MNRTGISRLQREEGFSPKTKDFDREGKLLFTQKIETLTDYVLVDAERIFVEHFSRNHVDEDWRWHIHTQRADVLLLPRVELELPLDEIYEELDLSEAHAQLLASYQFSMRFSMRESGMNQIAATTP